MLLFKIWFSFLEQANFDSSLQLRNGSSIEYCIGGKIYPFMDFDEAILDMSDGFSSSLTEIKVQLESQPEV